MRTIHMHGVLLPLLAIALLLDGPAIAQDVSLEDLWPHVDGTGWIFDGSYREPVVSEPLETFVATLTFEGTQVLGGQQVQILTGSLVGTPARTAGESPSGLDPVTAHLWRFRPDLRTALGESGTTLGRAEDFWPFLLLHPADGNIGFLATFDAIGDWRDEIAARSWIYLISDLQAGAQFELQLIPDLADDVFLYGSVLSADVVVDTPARSFAHAWVMEYRIDTGLQTVTDEMGGELGTQRIETFGTVAFAAGVGPVAVLEETRVTESNCPQCPQQVDDVLFEGAMTLRDVTVDVESMSWSKLKSGY